MASLITLKRRISSIRSTRQITKAMELVSASKLRRAQDVARTTRPYREATQQLLARLGAERETDEWPLFQERPIHARLYVVITSNSGLAGAYNANVLKLLTQNLRRDATEKTTSSVIAVGSKGAQFVRRLTGIELLAYYPAFGDHPSQSAMLPVLRGAISQYQTKAVDEVVVLYTQARSGILQEAISLSLLPAQLEVGAHPPVLTGPATTFEPDAATVVEQVASRLIETQLWQVVLESQASEHAARMLAMKNATDNANELINDYTLEYNTARQASITQELAEITGGAEALK